MNAKYKREHMLLILFLVAVSLAYAYYGVLGHGYPSILVFYALYRYDLRNRIHEAELDAIYWSSVRRTLRMINQTKREMREWSRR